MFVCGISGFRKEDTRPIEEIVREKLLTVLESAYPNVLSVEDLVRSVLCVCFCVCVCVLFCCCFLDFLGGGGGGGRSAVTTVSSGLMAVPGYKTHTSSSSSSLPSKISSGHHTGKILALVNLVAV